MHFIHDNHQETKLTHKNVPQNLCRCMTLHILIGSTGVIWNKKKIIGECLSNIQCSLD